MGALRLAGLRGRVTRRCGWHDLAMPASSVPVVGLMRDGRWVMIVKAETRIDGPVVHLLDAADPGRGVVALARDAFLPRWTGALVVIDAAPTPDRARKRPAAAWRRTCMAMAAVTAPAVVLAWALLGAPPPGLSVPAAAGFGIPAAAPAPLPQVWLQAEQARVEAELEGAAFDPPADTAEWALQRTLHRQRQAQHAARLQAFDDRLDAAATALAIAAQGRALLVQQLDLAREMEAMRAALYRVQSGSKLSLMEAQAARLHAEHALQTGISQFHAARQAAPAIAMERTAYLGTWRQNLLETLIRTRTKAAALDGPGLAAAMTAPVATSPPPPPAGTGPRGRMSALLAPVFDGLARGLRGLQAAVMAGHGGPAA